MQPILIKAKVRAHVRHTKSGKAVQVREHQDSREKRAEADKKYLTSIARTIQQQIGHQALYMIGAKQFIMGHTESRDPYLQFRIGRNSKGVHIVKIALNQMDTYDVEFSAVRKGPKHVILSTEEGIYNDMLIGSIERNTGMATSLGTMGKAKVSAHLRRTKGGKIVSVRAYENKVPKADRLGLRKWASEYMQQYKAGNTKGAATTLQNIGRRATALGLNPQKVEQYLGLPQFREQWDKTSAATKAAKTKPVKAPKARGKIQGAIIGYLARLDVPGAKISLTDMVRHPDFKGFHFKNVMESAIALKRAGHIKYDGDKVQMVTAAPAKGVKEWRHMHGGKIYVTTDLALKGRGIILSDDGSGHARGLRTYFITKAAFKKVQATHGEFTYQDLNKSVGSGNMSDLTKYPDLKKAVEIGSLSKSLEFTKTGTEIYNGIMAKLGACQGELQRMIAKWKAGVQPVSDDSPVGEASEVAEKPEREPWEIRSKRREIDKLERISRNIDLKKKYKLSEYDLSEYGL